ncbi:MAG TPA: hypothetical protein VMM55_11815 [Thermohalobaculum sp.]|nr:hypothetical protein [Thermohalobaculum sp.]
MVPGAERAGCAVAREQTGGRIVATQEGGYNPAHAPFCAYATVAGLLGLPLEVEEPLAFYPDDPAVAEAAVAALIARHPLL